MRIPTSQIYNQGLSAVLSSQKKLINVQNQLARETKILTPADDPVGKAQVIGLDDRIAQNEQFQRNATLLKNRLQRTDSVYANITTSLDRARSLMVQSGNGIFDGQDRRALSEEFIGIRDEVLGLMNSQDENGDYLFSGFQKQLEPFSRNPVTRAFDYHGDDGRNQTQLSPSLKVAAVDPGSETFQNIAANRTLYFQDSNSAVSGIQARVVDRDQFDSFHDAQFNKTQIAQDNTLQLSFDGTDITVTRINQAGDPVVAGPLPYTPGERFTFEGIEIQFDGELSPGDTVDLRLGEPTQNILTTLDNFIDALRNGDIETDFFQAQLTDALQNMDRAQQALSASRAQTGGRLNTLQGALNNNMDLEISNRETRSKITDVDYSVAMTELTKQDVSLQAAQATFTRLTRLSLFDFIR